MPADDSGTDPARGQRWARVGLVPVAALFALHVGTGLLGIDFGTHWDEKAQFHNVNNTIDSGVLLSLDYHHYPSMTFVLSVLAQGTTVFRRLETGPLLEFQSFLLQTRPVFLVLVAAGGFWVYLAVRSIAHEVAAVAGAAVYLLSWQLAYHARWIAPDGLLAHATALHVFAVVRSWDAPAGSRRRYWPVVTAAIAATAKYQGAILFLSPLLLLVLDRTSGKSRRAAAGDVARAILLFVSLFVIWNPATVLEPAAFLRDVLFENAHYRTTHGRFSSARPYDIAGPLSYGRRLLDFVAVALPSPFPWVSVALVAVAGIGARSLVRRSRDLALIVLVPPGVAFLYFCTLRVFIVRNFLLFLPVLAFLVGLGADHLRSRLRARVGPPATLVLVAAVAVLTVTSGYVLVDRASTIRDGTGGAAEGVRRLLAGPGRDDLVLSPGTAALLTDRGLLPDEVSTAVVPPPGRAFAILQSEVRTRYRVRSWPSTDRNTFRTFGPREVDFDFYSTWESRDRVIVLSPQQVEAYSLSPRAAATMSG